MIVEAGGSGRDFLFKNSFSEDMTGQNVFSQGMAGFLGHPVVIFFCPSPLPQPLMVRP